MAPLPEWLRPPKLLLSILFLLTLVSVSALAWFGAQFVEQDRMVEAQRAQERREQAADRIAATLRGMQAETGERVGSWLSTPPAPGKPEDGAALITGAGGGVEIYPAGRLVYRPTPPGEPEAESGVFAEGEALEFLQAQPRQAAEWYRGLTSSPNLAVRAGALMRLGRVLSKLGPGAESRAAYVRLAGIAGVRVAGAPAELVGMHALGDAREAIQKDLLAGRWALTRGQFEFYWSEVTGGEPPSEVRGLAEAAAVAWAQPGSRGQTTVWAGGRPFAAIWRGVGTRRALWIAPADAMIKRLLPADLAVAAVDGEGRVVFGSRDRSQRAAVRAAAEDGLPWTIYVSSYVPPAGPARASSSGRFLIAGTAVMVLFLLGGTYFMARAIRREIEVSRMQSDFVSAVSHEFRSPLTSIRQFSEMLAAGRVPNEERRQVYHATLVRETGRLQRLVEALLNFGRMEAGARAYRFEEVDAAELAHRVAAEFENEIAAGRRIELHGNGGCRLQADPEALSVALRNLVDNALKYSPEHPTVWVEWARENGRVVIRVKDRGAGVAPGEHRAIFRKFVRGTAAAGGNVKGSGVGLAMVRHIVDAHGGEIQVSSKPGEGSTFTVLLPAKEK